MPLPATGQEGTEERRRLLSGVGEGVRLEARVSEGVCVGEGEEGASIELRTAD